MLICYWTNLGAGNKMVPRKITEDAEKNSYFRVLEMGTIVPDLWNLKHGQKVQQFILFYPCIGDRCILRCTP